MTLLVSLSLAAAVLGTPPPAVTDTGSRESHRFALVLGNNSAPTDALAPLRYADDDAVRVAEFLSEQGVDVELLATLDQDSQRRFPAAVRRAHPATHAELEAALTRVRERIADAKSAGETTELTVFYSGHGDLGSDGQPYLTLSDGRLSRHDLYKDVLEKSGANYNHLLVDACRAEALVLGRGPWVDDRAPAPGVQAYLDSASLTGHPTTGAIVATAADGRTHEWSEYAGGVFTHELLSALRGGADFNGDGVLEYSEVGAFVSAANHAVEDPRARLQVQVHAPAQDRRRALIRHRALATRRVLYFDAAQDEAFTVEDARGVRLADLRLEGTRPAYLTVPPGALYVHRERAGTTHEAQVDAATNARVNVRALPFEPSARERKGAVDVALRQGLFATPFGASYYAGYTDTQGLLAVHDPKWRVDVWHDGEHHVIETTEFDPPSSDCHVCFEGECEPCKEYVYASKSRARTTWVGLEFETLFNPSSPVPEIPRDSVRMFSDDLDPWFGAVRGFGLKSFLFSTSDRDKYGQAYGYLRTGFTRGSAAFSEPTRQFRDTDVTHARVSAVPLFVGGSLYAFEKFPLRPFVGGDVGVNIVTARFERRSGESTTHVKGGFGVSLHAGLQLKLTNYFSLHAAVMQQWSQRRKIGGVPDPKDNQFSFTTGFSVAIPAYKSKGHSVRHRVRLREKDAKALRRDGPYRLRPAKTPERSDNEQEPASSAVEVRVTTGAAGGPSGPNAPTPPTPPDPPVPPTAPMPPTPPESSGNVPSSDPPGATVSPPPLGSVVGLLRL